MLTKLFAKRSAVAALILGLGLALAACESSPDEEAEEAEETEQEEQELTDEEEADDGAEVGAIDGLEDSDELPVGDSPILGDEGAPVTIVEFTSMQCPFCARAADTLDEIVEDYDGQVRLVFKHFPLPNQTEAEPASRAMVAAERQDPDAFWDMKSALFDRIDDYASGEMEDLGAEIAEELGLDVEQFREDFNDEDVAEIVERDHELGQSLGVQGTPHFFINGEVVNGAQPYEEFASVVDDKLEQVDALKDEGVEPAQVYSEAIDRNM